MSTRIWNRLFRRRKRSGEGRGIASRYQSRYQIPALGLLFVLLMLASSCGVPTVTFIAEPLFRTPTGSTLRFDHNTANDTEDFRGYELYYKIYDANDTAEIDSDRSYIEGADTPGTSRLVLRSFLRMVRTDTGEPAGTGQLDPPIVPVSSGQRDNAFTVSVDFSAAVETVLVTNPGEGASFQLFRQNVLLSEQTVATTFDRFLDPAAYQYDPAGSSNDADLAAMLNAAYEDVASYRAAVAVIAYGIDATNFQRIYSTPIYLGIVPLGI